MPSRPTAPGRRRVLVLLLPDLHLLDLSGPVQVFHEANGFGAAYDLHFCGVKPTVTSAQGLRFSNLEPLPDPEPNDTVLVPGMDSTTLDRLGHVPNRWLRAALDTGARLCSICSGAFALARAGLLDHRQCTTHWKIAERLHSEYPRARVLTNRLFVRDGNVITSAGVAAGIDMALAIVDEDHGPLTVARVAREMVMYLRRDADSEPGSMYLSYRTHLHPGIHRVQDWLVAHPEKKPTIEQLARIAGMSTRNLTRHFRLATGITLKTFSNKLKLEVAENLLHDPSLTLDNVASRCGFQDPRQLRRLWKQAFGESPSEWKQRMTGKRAS